MAVAAAVALPTLRMGYLRDDWFLLWHVLDRASAPDGAGGVFFRPVAQWLWSLATAAGGDHPLAMHLPMLLLAVLAAALAAAVARARGAGPMAWVAAAGVGTHYSLIELRLWAAASNGLLALVLGLLGWWLAVGPRAGVARRLLAVGLVALAGLARADAWAFLLPVLLTFGWPRALALASGAILVAAGLWASLSQAGAGWTLDAAAALRSLRWLAFPWGGPRAPALEAVAAVAVAGAVLLAARRLRTAEAWVEAGLVLGVPAAIALLPWGGAGRYLAVPVACASILAARALPARAAGPAVGLVVLHLLSPWMGSAAADLRARGEVETALYRFVRRERPAPPLRLVDPPPLGWTDSPADAENVASAALRRIVEVEFVDVPQTGAILWVPTERRWRHP